MNLRSVKTRPPGRPDASSTVTSAPASRSASAAARPPKPAPITTAFMPTPRLSLLKIPHPLTPPSVPATSAAVATPPERFRKSRRENPALDGSPRRSPCRITARYALLAMCESPRVREAASGFQTGGAE
jgi:hypothetical protein